jgi:uncharacterized protein YqgV (UPF0045/DUF77 family)
MRIAVDISLYPIADDFIPPIDDVIERFNSHESLEVITNPMSTQIYGEYDVVMAALNREIKATFESSPRAVFAIKILNNPISL